MVGDYLLQSHWMATEKTRRTIVALIHASIYGLPFLLLEPSTLAYAVIVGTHFLIDRWQLARFVVHAKNLLSPIDDWDSWKDCSRTGYHKDVPAWLSVWLLIIADNILHVLINGLALRYL